MIEFTVVPIFAEASSQSDYFNALQIDDELNHP